MQVNRWKAFWSVLPLQFWSLVAVLLFSFNMMLRNKRCFPDAAFEEDQFVKVWLCFLCVCNILHFLSDIPWVQRWSVTRLLADVLAGSHHLVLAAPRWIGRLPGVKLADRRRLFWLDWLLRFLIPICQRIPTTFSASLLPGNIIAGKCFSVKIVSFSFYNFTKTVEKHSYHLPVPFSSKAKPGFIRTQFLTSPHY